MCVFFFCCKSLVLPGLSPRVGVLMWNCRVGNGGGAGAYKYLCLTPPSGTERAKALIQTKEKGLFNGNREPAPWRGSGWHSHPLAPKLFHHWLILAARSCRDCDLPPPNRTTDISPVSESGNRELPLSMSHQRACLRTAVDVSTLPQALTLAEE